MTLKALVTQLECQGVDPGYIQRFDWERWISRSYLIRSLDYMTVKENTRKTKSLVLHLLQEYLKVVDVEYIKTLQETPEELRGNLEEASQERDQAQREVKNVEEDLISMRGKIDELERGLVKAEHEVELLLEREETLRGEIHGQDDGI